MINKAEKLRRFKKTKGYLNKQFKKRMKTEEKIKEEEWKRNVFERDNHTCQICEKKLEGKNKHPHHIIPKGFKPLRWDVMNGITLCYQHHKVNINSPHMNALWFSEWLKNEKFEQWDYLMGFMGYEHIKNGNDKKKEKELEIMNSSY